MRRYTTAIVSVALLLASGCAKQSFGDAALCNTSVGANGMLVPDCANPSCQAMEACRLLPPLPIGAAAGAAADPPIPNVPALVVTDAAPSAVPGSAPTPPSMTPDATPFPPQEQTPENTDCSGKGGCNKDKNCKGSDCGAALTPPATDMMITRISVIVPRSVDGGVTCLDPNDACSSYSVSPFLQCGCAPNPVVAVSVDDVQIAETIMSPASDLASWETLISVKIEAQSMISLRVFDADGDAREKIFGCEFSGSSEGVAGGSLVCTKQFPTIAGPADYTVMATISSTAN